MFVMIRPLTNKGNLSKLLFLTRQSMYKFKNEKGWQGYTAPCRHQHESETKFFLQEEEKCTDWRSDEIAPAEVIFKFFALLTKVCRPTATVKYSFHEARN